MNPVKVEVGQYREVNKGALKAFFSLVIYPEGQKILDCRYFVHGDKAWFSFPQKTVEKDGEKPEYIPLISYLNKEYLEQLKIAILAALKQQKPKESNGKNYQRSNTNQGQAHPLPSQPPIDEPELPF